MIFGTNVSVCSWIDVTVWKIDTIRPTASDTKRSGAETVMTIYNASDIIIVTVSAVIGYSSYQ